MLHGRRKVALIATITLTCHLLLSITVTTVTKTTPMAASIQVMEVVWIDTATVEAEPTACTVKRLLRHLRSTECLPAGTTSRPDSITTTSLRPENSSSSSNRGMVAVASTWLNIAIKEDQPLNCIKNQVNHEVTSCTWNTPPDREFAAVTANRLQSTTLHRRLLRRPTVR